MIPNLKMGMAETVHKREHSHDDRSVITSAFAKCRGEEKEYACSEGVSKAEY
jgi:hypothetical protein